MVDSYSYNLTITLHPETTPKQEAIWSALKPEFASIDSKRVKFHSKSNRKSLVFHLTALDVTALRAAATTLMRLYVVADGVHQITVKKNG
ncbi:MAG: KEOPS complex subunit Pcc1 [Candidatus Hermodarchaeia archaeon]|jgi:tRNA threonylcarbamoyladenosine modification (KEOPS) complex  Pcc1 subunit